jgi:poly-D-alanine transfer protein DltD
MYVQGLTRRSIRRFATVQSDVKILGVRIISEAFRHPDVLPNFGSSELIRGRARPFYGPDFFATAPSGFVLFPVADLGATPLATLLRVGAAGAELRGKRVVLSFTPSIFFGRSDSRVEAAYRGNFSPLQASLLIFSSDLSPSLNQDLAVALLKHPGDPPA